MYLLWALQKRSFHMRAREREEEEETIFIIQIIVQAAKEKSDEVVWLSLQKRGSGRRRLSEERKNRPRSVKTWTC